MRQSVRKLLVFCLVYFQAHYINADNLSDVLMSVLTALELIEVLIWFRYIRLFFYTDNHNSIVRRVLRYIMFF